VGHAPAGPLVPPLHASETVQVLLTTPAKPHERWWGMVLSYAGGAVAVAASPQVTACTSVRSTQRQKHGTDQDEHLEAKHGAANGSERRRGTTWRRLGSRRVNSRPRLDGLWRAWARSLGL